MKVLAMSQAADLLNVVARLGGMLYLADRARIQVRGWLTRRMWREMDRQEKEAKKIDAARAVLEPRPPMPPPEPPPGMHRIACADCGARLPAYSPVSCGGVPPAATRHDVLRARPVPGRGVPHDDDE